MLGVTVDAAEEVLSSASRLSQMIGATQYQGPLMSFMGRRWWRAGVSYVVEQLLGEFDLEDDHDLEAVAAAASSIHGRRLERVSVIDPVLEVQSDYSIAPDPISALDAVRLQPDDWPPYADEAWAGRSRLDGEDPELLALVVSSDRWRLHSSELKGDSLGQENGIDAAMGGGR
ncbi:hypothetical protein [Micromonospora zamorensis]|uniref:hypothetical protein n=1 Tax=Micromonospora zamorensis TaxID=709883 RepID=UPI0012FDEB8A|nr:hypothetical protein [Micromonospora zamorensis]